MKVTYDRYADAIYLYLRDRIERGEVEKTFPINDDVIVDFDGEDNVLGIEILSASKVSSLKSFSFIDITEGVDEGDL